ncbi:type VII secretion protein EccB [Longispora fulva]|uniref:Type VII secretion protein EccB n=1 Tax=Longispora fulva TaxID=619741 RepID=A0A8J7GNK2_9ACTN|nr:type VII secretion protein EccB [Longispora fulva]MBG6140273.1 type VII secretion protein EccB [Longispora fulva]GIG57348.1 type VII secretion protein EccB [Longispora fulva]
MRTRRDQVQAYRFVTRRLVSAMLSGEPETTNLPLRRLLLAAIGSVMIAVLVFAGVGAYGLLHPGGNESWKKDMTLVIERESGARYVYSQGKLFPVLNYASARLIVGDPNPVQELASRDSLAGTPRGRPVGIEGAPDSLPDPGALLGLPWSVCSAPKVADTADLATHLVIGSAPTGGSPLGAEGLLVSSGSSTYLLWGDHRLKVPDRTALAALGMTATPLPVGQALVDGITAGPDLAAPAIPGFGGEGRRVGAQATRIGAVYQSGSQYYVMLSDGLAPVHEVTANLLNAASSTFTQVSPADASAVPSATRVEPEGLPLTAPRLRTMDGATLPAVCAGYRGDPDKPITIDVYAKAPDQFAKPQEPAVTTGRDAVRTADRVVLPGGRGALVQARSAPGVPASGTVFLVTDQGIKYGLAGNAQAALGYAGATVIGVPAALLALVPTGPGLDPAAAVAAVGSGPGPESTPPVAPGRTASPTPKKT